MLLLLFGNKKRSECGLLAKVFTGLRLVILLEVSVEGKHALVKLRVRQRRRASTEMFNFELLIGEVQQWLRVDRNIFLHAGFQLRARPRKCPSSGQV